MAGSSRPVPATGAVVPVPEIRDYRAINLEIIRLLNEGQPRIILAGAHGQRLLAAGIAGPWRAVVEVDGDAGPELAAGLDAPGLTIVCRGGVEDGGASGLLSGFVAVMGSCGTAFGYAQRGGLAVAVGSVGPRAGLCQMGGDLVLLSDAGPLAGERQSGGRLFASARLGDHPGRGHRGGRLVRMVADGSAATDGNHSAWVSALEPVREWIHPDRLSNPAGHLISKAVPREGEPVPPATSALQ